MSIEYGLITKELSEKEIVSIFNSKLHHFFTGMVDKEYDRYKNYNLTKQRNLGGISLNPKYIPWDYEYSYFLGHKYYGLSMEIYPNTNERGECKFKELGVKWNLWINEIGWYMKDGDVIKENNPDIERFTQFLMEDLPFEVVVLYEYEDGEERI